MNESGSSEGGIGWLCPPPLRPGSVVRVVAPSGPFERRLVLRGLGWLAERYVVRWERGLFESHGYLAGSDRRREDELAAALAEPDVDAILCARGGYGASRFVHRLDWSMLRASPRWLVGFSDVTALHVEAAAVRVASLHGPNVTALGRGDAATRGSLLDALESSRVHAARAGLHALVRGEADGRLFGGNLTLLHACAVAGRLRVPDGAVLFLEDVTERPYRIDRMLTTLVAGGHLARIAGIVLGDFTECAPGVDGVSVRDVVREVLVPLGVPLAAGLRSGHGDVNEPLVLGARVRLDAGADARLTFLGG